MRHCTGCRATKSSQKPLQACRPGGKPGFCRFGISCLPAAHSYIIFCFAPFPLLRCLSLFFYFPSPSCLFTLLLLFCSSPAFSALFCFFTRLCFYYAFRASFAFQASPFFLLPSAFSPYVPFAFCFASVAASPNLHLPCCCFAFFLFCIKIPCKGLLFPFLMRQVGQIPRCQPTLAANFPLFKGWAFFT